MKEGVSRFTEVITEDEGREIVEEPEVSNFKEEKKKRAILRKEKRDAWAAACLSAGRLRGSSAAGPVSGSSAPSPLLVPGLSALSASTGSAGSVPGLSALSASAGSAVPVPGSFAPSASAGSAESVPGSSAPSISIGSAVPVPNLSTPSTSALSAFTPSVSSESAFPVPGSSTSAAPVFGSSAFSVSVVTPTPGRQKLIELNRREKKATSEELAPAFTPLLPSEPPFLFPASCVGEKRSFDKAFDINC